MQLEISRYKRIVVLTGAGVSAESGISTFRDAGGLWEQHRIDDVATPEAFQANPLLVWRFYSLRRVAAAKARPNPAHLALANFESTAQAKGLAFTLITQNVDCLHERAFSHPLAMHGTLSLSRCGTCNQVFQDPHSWFNAEGAPTPSLLPELLLPRSQTPRSSLLPGSDTSSSIPLLSLDSVLRKANGLPLSPCCQCELRPHIVWFGEIPLFLEEIHEAISSCEIFMSIGTSGLVYPAAGFIEQAKFAGAQTACFNKEPLPRMGMVDFYIEGSAADTIPKLFKT